MPMLQRRATSARALPAFRRRLSALCGETDSVHPTPFADCPCEESGEVPCGPATGYGIWPARIEHPSYGEACGMAASAGEIVETTARQWGVM